MSSRFDEFLFGKPRVTSVFRADVGEGSPQPLPQRRTQVLYTNQLKDTNNEYDPVTSTFIPKQNGVYSFNASIGFITENPNTNYWVTLELFVNDAISPVAATVGDFFPGLFGDTGQVTLSTIQQLRAGDRVTVFANVSRPASILNINPYFSLFEGARIG